MILPNKYISISESYFGISALILDCLADKNLTIDELWSVFSKKYLNTNKISQKPTYQKFIYVIEFMYLCGMITYNDEGEIVNENLKFKN